MFFIKREMRHFHVVVFHLRQRNLQRGVMHVQSCCFANQTYCFFLPFLLPSPSSLLKLSSKSAALTFSFISIRELEDYQRENRGSVNRLPQY